eukprot:4216379-Lingulodinium_polyedra.AAC.1
MPGASGFCLASSVVYRSALMVNFQSTTCRGVEMGARVGSMFRHFPHHDPFGRNKGMQRARWPSPK